MAVHMAGVDDVFDGGLFCVVFPNTISLEGSEIEMRHFLKLLLLIVISTIVKR